MNKNFSKEADDFLNNEKQFHLGMLPTEQAHPETTKLSWTLERDISEGIRLLQLVDRDIEKSCRHFFNDPSYKKLCCTLAETLKDGGRVCFSGCGATGRLSILLESCWRKFWKNLAIQNIASSTKCKKYADQVCSIMTGGDFALIRSVEGFEDYKSFGRRQVFEANLKKRDVLVAISEGGETSSVIGTVLEARDQGAEAFFVFNNPADILCKHIERSRDIIQRDDITTIDLSTGPMAVAGSTRMQATTAELLVIGTALDQVLTKLLPDILTHSEFAQLPDQWKILHDPEKLFSNLLQDLSNDKAIAALKKWVEIEQQLYAEYGRITYYADSFLLDIFTDTTERSPTFMLPPFRKIDDEISAPSWAFVKDPMRSTIDAWEHVLARKPRCLEWNESVYRKTGASENLCTHPPVLNRKEIYKFTIGYDDDYSRYVNIESIAMAVLHDKEILKDSFSDWWNSFSYTAKHFSSQKVTVIGHEIPSRFAGADVLHIPCNIQSTPLDLWARLAVKLVLNTISTAVMGCSGRLVGNWMAYVDTSNKKLIDRGTRLIAELADIDYTTACHELHKTIAELKNIPDNCEKPSPVAETIKRLCENNNKLCCH